MKKLWLTTTGIFLFQVVSGGLVYILTGDFVTAAFASVLATALLSATTHATATRLAVLTATAFLTAIGGFAITAFVSVLAIAAFATTTSATTTVLVALTAIAATTAFLTAIVGFVAATAAAQTARDNGAKEPLWALWLTAIPLGVGTLCGGVFLVLRLRQDRLTFPT